jgi:DNA-directed RNA polymerase specialized sigma24 family protein
LLARDLRALCLDTGRRGGLSYDAASDVAQSTVPKVLRAIERGAVREGCEAAYARTAARNEVATQHRRDKSGVRLMPTAGENLEAHADDSDSIEEALVAREEAAEQARRATRARALLEQAPERYRAALTHVHGQGGSIEELVTLELARRGDDGNDPRARGRARAVVDKVLQRARDWLRSRLAVEGGAA